MLLRRCWLALVLVSQVKGQCDVKNCSKDCLPEQWQRDLCQFYLELEDWRSAAADCGLEVPVLERDTALGAEEQWLMAREQWNTLRGIWEEAAKQEGVFSQEQTQEMPVGGVEDGRTLEDVWQEELGMWQGRYDDWREYIQGQGLTISPSNPQPITTPDSRVWFMQLTDWSDDFNRYSNTYECPIPQ